MEKDCGLWINMLSHKLRKRINANMQKLGLTGVQSRVISYILVKCADGPVYQRDVESTFGLSRSTATGILQLMERDGLILRKSVASDMRLKSLIPTEKAQRLGKQISESLSQMEQCLTEGLTSTQLALFLETAAHMCANLDR